jgi:hypothetical protein
MKRTLTNISTTEPAKRDRQTEPEHKSQTQSSVSLAPIVEKLLLTTPIESLAQMCQLNKVTRDLCRHPYVWRERFRREFPKSFAIFERILAKHRSEPAMKCALIMCEKNIRTDAQFNTWAAEVKKAGGADKSKQAAYEEARDCHRRGIYCTSDISLGIIYKHMYLGEHLVGYAHVIFSQIR